MKKAALLSILLFSTWAHADDRPVAPRATDPVGSVTPDYVAPDTAPTDTTPANTDPANTAPDKPDTAATPDKPVLPEEGPDVVVLPTPTPAPTPQPVSMVQPGRLPNLMESIRFKDLTKNWRRFSLSNDSTSPFGSSLGPAITQILADLGIGVYFTKGESYTIGKESFLIAYRVDTGVDGIDLNNEVQSRLNVVWGHGNTTQSPLSFPGKFSPRTVLRLSLINLRSAGDLRDIRVFDMNRDVLSPQDLRAISTDNLRSITLFFTQYGGSPMNFQGMPIRDLQTLRQSFQNFHASSLILRDPNTGDFYRVNPALSAKLPSNMRNQSLVPAIYEAAASSDGTRGVIFLDNHFERVKESDWKAISARLPQGPPPAEYRRLSGEQLSTIGRQIVQYAGSHYGQLPPIASNLQTRRTLIYTFNEGYQVYLHPQTKKPYLYNKAISGLKLNNVLNRKNVVSVYEAAASSDGTIGAAFLDGKVRRIPKAQWGRVIAVKPQMKVVVKPVAEMVKPAPRYSRPVFRPRIRRGARRSP